MESAALKISKGATVLRHCVDAYATSAKSVAERFRRFRSPFMATITMSAAFSDSALKFFCRKYLSAAQAHTSALAINFNISSNEFMAALAKGLSRVHCRSANTSKHVNAIGNRFQVRGIYAARVSAQMIQRKTLRNRAGQQGVRHAMGEQPLSIKPRVTVPLTFSASPTPATFSFFNFVPKSFFLGFHNYGVL